MITRKFPIVQPMMNRTIINRLMAALLVGSLHTVPSLAQGNNSGQGGDDKSIQSLASRLLHLENQSEAFNLFLNLHTSYQERFDGDNAGGSLKGRQLRLEMKGNLDDHWSYRLRYRLNRPGEQQDDNFSNNIDFMQVNYRINDRWRLTFGKKELNLGGYEFDYNPIQVLEYSEFMDALAEFHLSAQVAYTIAKGHDLQLEVFNSNNNSVENVYKNAGLERSRHPLGVNLNWTGNMFDGKLQTLWACNYMREAQGASTKMVMLGQQLNMPKWHVFVDYYGAWEGADRHGIVSADMGGLARDVVYNSVIGEVHYQPTPHWNLFVKGAVEKASARKTEAFRNYRTSYTYQTAVQYFPDLTQDARLSLAYIGRSVKYNDDCGLDNFNTNRIELSLIYRIKIF